MNEMQFGERLMLLRTQMGISQMELSLRTNLQSSYIGRLELGKKNPTLTTLSKLAEGLGVSLSDLLRDEAPVPKDQDELINKVVSYMLPLDERSKKDVVEVVRIVAKNRLDI